MQLIIAWSLALSVFAGRPNPASWPKISRIHIDKGQHRLSTYSGRQLVKVYDIALGRGGPGPKEFEGDKKTPVGTYRIIARIPRLFHRFMTLSYPNASDRKAFRERVARGLVPKGRGVGGGVGIHGGGVGEDWTFGCIALENRDMDELWERVSVGTEVVIEE